MKQNRLTLLLCSALAGALLALPKHLGGDFLLGLLETAGNWLRELSLSGVPGNLAAWCIVYALCAPPLALMALRWRKHPKVTADWLAPLASLLIFSGIYALVNPTHLDAPLGLYQIWAPALWTAALSVLVCWGVLLALANMEQGDEAALTRALSALLVGIAALLVFSAVNGAVNECLALIQQGEAGSTASDSLAAIALGETRMDVSIWNSRTAILLWVLAALELIPSLLGAVVLLWGADLVHAMQAEPFGEETVALCGKTAQSCRHVAAWSVLLCVGANLLQLIVLPYVAQTSFSVRLPLVTLLLSASLFLLCRCFQRGRELQEDSDSII